VAQQGGDRPCVLNAANEVAVQAFLSREIPFIAIPEVVEETLNRLPSVSNPNLETLFEVDAQARQIAKSILKKFNKV